MTAPTQVLPVLTPYSTIRDFSGAGFGQGTTPGYLSAVDQQRLLAYQLYEQIYWNVPDTFRIVSRGTGSNPVYVPTARTIIDTVDRYVGSGFDWMVDPASAAETEVAAAKAAFGLLFARERFRSAFDANKLFGLMRGDWCWHILGDPAKPLGTRISIRPLDPGSFFKITHPNDVDRVLGVDIIEQITDNDEVRLKVQRYTKGPDPIKEPDNQDGLIYSSLGIWKLDDWGDPEKGPAQVLVPPTALPSQITALPVYHIPNFETPGDPYGSSELRGFETVIAAVNQAVSDEDLALALEGLGLYATDSGPPRDETTGAPTSWKLGPGRVVELKTGTNFNRVTGVKDLKPYQDHLAFLINSLKEASAATDAAAGKVDVTVAESGVALLMQLSPMLAKAAKKERIISDVHTQMFFDLKGWLSAYEQVNLPTASILPIFGSKVPLNRSSELKDILSIVAVIPTLLPWAVRKINELGFDMTPEEVSAASVAQPADPQGDRLNQEVTSAAPVA